MVFYLFSLKLIQRFCFDLVVFMYPELQQSTFFLYIPLFKALMCDLVSNSSPLISSIGLLVFILAVIIAFLGYVLPLSQMSYWGLIVFSNLIATIPIVGKTVLYWLWGGEWISTETLSKIHALHVILPIISLGVILFHLLILHINTSSCGFFDRFTTSYEVCFFIDLSFYKDILFGIISFWIFVSMAWLYWDFVFHEESFVEMNTSKTSSKIIPEWFFLLFFGFIKAIPSKLGGLLLMGFQLGSLLLLFSWGTSLGSGSFKVLKFHWLGLLGISACMIGVLGAVVLLVHPLIEVLLTLNIFFLIYFYYKVI